MEAALSSRNSGRIFTTESDRKEEFRQMLHDELDEWVDELMFLFEDDRQPNLMEISEVFTETRQKFLGACLQRLIETKYAHLLDQEYYACPKCGKVCKKRLDSRKHMVTMQGPSRIERPWFYCTDCSHGFMPLDSVLEMSRKKHQFDIQKKAVNLAAEATFSRASEIFKDLTGLGITDHFIHETFEAVGLEAYLEDVIPYRRVASHEDPIKSILLHFPTIP